MATLTPKKEFGSFLNVLSSDGTLRMTVNEDTEGAVKREWESGDGKTGVKWELIYQKVEGFITSIEFYDGDYGRNIIVGIDDLKLSLGTNTPYGEDFMKKLPNIDITKPIALSPFAFEDDKGKTRKGVSIVQDGKKVQNFFYDFAKKTNIHGYPNPEFKTDKKGVVKPFSTDDWKLYFGTARKFLCDYIEEHHLIEAEKTAEDEAFDDLTAPAEKVGAF